MQKSCTVRGHARPSVDSAGRRLCCFLAATCRRGTAPGRTAGVQTISREQLPQVWQQASWLRVIEVFDLAVDPKRRRRDDEIWVKSPFTQEEKARCTSACRRISSRTSAAAKGAASCNFAGRCYVGRVWR